MNSKVKKLLAVTLSTAIMLSGSTVFANTENNEELTNEMISKNAATQGMVLLENENNALPLTSKKVALFGGGVYATVKGGTGSGYVTSDYKVNIYDGFLNAGYTVTSADWVDAYAEEYNRIQEEDTTISYYSKIWSGLTVPVPDPALTQNDIENASEADCAIYVISRVAGETTDRKVEEGDYYLTETEMANIKLMAENFENSIVVLNTCVIDTSFFQQIEELDSLLVMSLAGMEGGTALVEVMEGTVTPSGKLADTWAADYEDYPASETFSANDDITIQENYEEGIYVGYRYFDTFNVTPAYEFGYGLSYTDFSIKIKNLSVDAETLSMEVSVKNTGDTYSGKEVVQIYFSAPDGELEKPYQELIGFAKTDELQPGETQTLTIECSTTEMSSYSEELAAYVMEQGDYVIRVGNSSRNTSVAAVVRLDETKITEQLSNKVVCDQDLEELSNANVTPYSYEQEAAEIAAAPVINLSASSIATLYNASDTDDSPVTTYLPEGSDYVSPYESGSKAALFDYEETFEYVPVYPDAKLYDVYTGDITMEEFVAQLDLDTLATVVNGINSCSDHTVEVDNPIIGAKAASGVGVGKTTPNFIQSYGIPNISLSDGPAGLHPGGYNATAFPVGMLLAQTWDVDVIKQVGQAFGNEMAELGVTVLLAPGMNIHRDPLCGRNFEYYSEDPLVTGMAGTMMTLGVQSHPGIGVSIKHFAGNNQEASRSGGNSSMSERTLREIYLKGFEIAVKSSQPMTVMTAYNKVNGIQTSSDYELCTDILRGEWGFESIVISDWSTVSNNALDMHAGNDLIMPGDHISYITSAVLGSEPDFDEDGGIHVTEISLGGGWGVTKVSMWNSFLLDANGTDTCTVEVAADVKLNEGIAAMVEEGTASVTYNEDGSKTVTYFGIDRGAYITLGDVQKSAMHILNTLMKAYTVESVYNESTGYEPIEILPYSSYYDLSEYIRTTRSDILKLYDITVAADEGVTVTLDKSEASAGEKVNAALEVTDSSKEIDSVVLTDTNGSIVETLTGQNGQYTFNMPDKDVIFKVSLKDIEQPSNDPDPSPSESTAPSNPGSSPQTGDFIPMMAAILIIGGFSVMLVIKKRKTYK